MKRKLKYFEALLNNPASLSHREFNTKLREWTEFIKENPDKYEMLGKGWEEAHERIGQDLERRYPIWDEFEEIEFLLEQTSAAAKKGTIASEEIIAVHRRWLDFMKKYHLEYSFTEEMIAESERKIAAHIQAVENSRIASERLKIANLEVEAAKDQLAEALFEASEKLGRPVMIPSYRTPKRGRDN